MTDSEKVYLEHHRIGHARFGGIGGAVANITITKAAWDQMGRPEVLALTVHADGADRV